MSYKTALCVFTYNRFEETRENFEALEKCKNLDQFDVYVFSDGPKNEKDRKKVEKVRNYLSQLGNIPLKNIRYSDSNKGLANSIIEGVSAVFETYVRVIVLEDDLIVSPNFLEFMDSALSFYENDSNIFSISGYTPALDALNDYKKDYYFCPRGSSWGWATWKDRWETVDWEVKSYPKFAKNITAQMNFAQGGIDLPRMLRNQMKGRIDSWAIRWVYQQYLNQQATVYPTSSKLKNIGIGKTATHTKKTKRFITELDKGEQMVFEFEKFNGYNKKILSSFRKVFSMWRRIKDKF